jgi:hypothetical protein
MKTEAIALCIATKGDPEIRSRAFEELEDLKKLVETSDKLVFEFDAVKNQIAIAKSLAPMMDRLLKQKGQLRLQLQKMIDLFPDCSPVGIYESDNSVIEESKIVLEKTK